MKHETIMGELIFTDWALIESRCPYAECCVFCSTNAICLNAPHFPPLPPLWIKILKNGEVFRMGCGDHSVPDRSRIEPYKRGGLQIGPNFLVNFWHNSINHTRWHSKCLPYAGLSFMSMSIVIWLCFNLTKFDLASRPMDPVWLFSSLQLSNGNLFNFFCTES